MKSKLEPTIIEHQLEIHLNQNVNEAHVEEATDSWEQLEIHLNQNVNKLIWRRYLIAASVRNPSKLECKF